MSYRTIFAGEIYIDPIISADKVSTINSFVDERHEEKCYPSYYCPWEIVENKIVGTKEEGNYYEPEKWLKIIIEDFLPSYSINGIILCTGEQPNDNWRIRVENSKVYRDEGIISYINSEIVV